MSVSLPSLDRDRIRELFDLRQHAGSFSGGGYTGDPHARWHDLRATGPVHLGIVHELTGYEGDAFFHGSPGARPPALLGLQVVLTPR